MRIAGFEILDQVGEGQMTVIWRARQLALDRTVSIKVLKPEYAAIPEELQRFIREARTGASLNHPNIVQIYDVAESDGVYYFVMEYVDGSTVAQILEVHGAIPQEQALRIAACVARALQNAWEKSRVIHRNIKPANIRIDEGGNVKLMYLGLSQRALPADRAAEARPEKIEGTPHYMAPEQAMGRVLDCRADMYGLGASLYHMVTGKIPFEDSDPADAMKQHVREQLPNPRDVLPSLSPPVVYLITKLMMKDPEDRFKDWSQAAETIDRILAGHVVVGNFRSGAESTVAPPGAVRPVVMRRQKPPVQVRRQKQEPRRMQMPPRENVVPGTPPNAGARPPAPVRAKPVRPPFAPAWLRVTAWSMMLVWSGLLAYQLRVAPSPVRPPLLVRPLPPPPAPVAVPVAPAPVPAPVQPANPPADAVVPAPAVTAPPAVPVDRDKTVLKEIGQGVVRALLKGNAAEAKSLVQSELAGTRSDKLKKPLRDMEALVAAMSGMDAPILAAFRGAIGKPVTVQFDDSRRALIPRSVDGTDVTATLGSDPAQTPPGQSVTFSIYEINPVDRARWMGTVDGPAKAAAKALLYLKGEDYASATTFAKQAGCLSDAMTAEILARQAGGDRK